MRTEAFVVLSPGGPFVQQPVEIDVDGLQPHEALVEIKATSICHTDIHYINDTSLAGRFPGVFGHEGAGVVKKTGSAVTQASPGDHVCISFDSCGHCRQCVGGQTAYCDSWEKLNFGASRPDGSKAYSFPDTASNGDSRRPISSHFFGQSSMSRHVICSERCLVVVRKDVPLEILSPLGCGIMTGAGAMLNHALVTSSSLVPTTVAVIGTGGVGLSAIMAAKLADNPPQRIVAVDMVWSRLNLARKLGATDIINSTETPDLAEAFLRISRGRGLDAVIDTTGRPDIISAALQAIEKRGKVISVGLGKPDGELKTSIPRTLPTGRVYEGCSMGSCEPKVFIPKMIEAWKDGRFPFTELLKTYPAQDVALAVKEMHAGEAIKVVLLWE
ncbi:hypothetical protein A1O1_07574 [Capronia coronata CBS 617.96]|uniref:Enoyl reductase (ER) domain-containing protein n=1 Tax=Capronia coronata CBS 617.96 TaxID=1182541 RepID=W9XVY6_9EURO|nr:uncharacterized protein A1O1_07574 [Capronia coronata CBS 617.96]EXJ81510.1 hypothetical protein A1O1_07574 [Capronia coronata CBS 617.96]